MKQKRSVLWWILIGWWLYTIYFLLVWWWLTPIQRLRKNKKDQTKTKNNISTPPLSLDIVGTAYYRNNINLWQSENNRDQWFNGRYSSKPLYQYSYLDNVNDVYLIPEPENKHDKNAIAVYLGNQKAGYIPSDQNAAVGIYIRQPYYVTAKLFGGDSKQLDRYGDLIVTKNDYKMRIQISRS